MFVVSPGLPCLWCVASAQLPKAPLGTVKQPKLVHSSPISQNRPTSFESYLASNLAILPRPLRTFQHFLESHLSSNLSALLPAITATIIDSHCCQVVAGSDTALAGQCQKKDSCRDFCRGFKAWCARQIYLGFYWFLLGSSCNPVFGPCAGQILHVSWQQQAGGNEEGMEGHV